MMTERQKGSMICRIINTMKQACVSLNASNPHKVRAFDSGDTFLRLAFMTDKQLLTLDRKVHI